MRVLTYPEKQTAELGAIRWEVSYWMLRPGVPETKGEWGEGDQFDFDRDLVEHFETFGTREAAFDAARKIVERGTFFGCATVEKQRVDWFVEEDRVGEWVGIGEVEEVA